jgi:hypothetical protein
LIGKPFLSHWYELAALAVSVTLPPEQKVVGPEGATEGTNAPTPVCALPVVEQPLSVTVTPNEIGPFAPAEKVIVSLPWPAVIVPFVMDHAYWAPPCARTEALLEVLAQTLAGAVIVEDGSGFEVTLTAGDVTLQPLPSVTVTLYAPEAVALKLEPFAPPIGEPSADHWYDTPLGDAVRMTLPPAQNEVGPLGVATGARTSIATLADPFEVQPFVVTLAPTETLPLLPAANAMLLVPCPLVIEPFVTVQL